MKEGFFFSSEHEEFIPPFKPLQVQVQDAGPLALLALAPALQA
jgi:hypothetical protein